MQLEKTKVISSRVPVDVYDRLQNILTDKQISVSEYIKQDLLNVKIKRVDVSQDIPEELKNMLSAGGGLLVGSIVYHAIKKNLPKNKFTQDEIDLYSWISAVAVGLISVWGLAKLMKE